MKIIALDFGERKIGIAIGDTEIGVAAARDFLENSSEATAAIAELAEREGVEKIIIGLPRGLSGDTEQTESARDFAEELDAKTQAIVELIDERFTSRIAEANLQSAGQDSRQQKTLIDSESARIILQEYLDRNF